MIIQDHIHFSLLALSRHRARTLLMMLAMAIAIAAVVMLTALGEGARNYVVGQFSSLGTNLLIVLPGRTETTGGGLASFIGQTPRDLTIEDSQALLRSSLIKQVAPVVVGSAGVSWSGRSRDVAILGSTASVLQIRHWEMERGSFLPDNDAQTAKSVCVLGSKVKEELFGEARAVGEFVRIGNRRFRVIGILASEGRSIGIDVEDIVIVPVASAMQLFNTSTLFRILAEANEHDQIDRAKEFISRTIAQRHQGEEDVTVVTQDAVLSTFDKILRALTLTVTGIASISLAVAGVLIMNIMLVSVSQRTNEIGLLKALGATAKQVVRLFIVEAVMLSLLGALCGVLLGQLGAHVIRQLYPAFPVAAPWWSILLAVAVAGITGLIFGVMPAKRAAKLDPVQALSGR